MISLQTMRDRKRIKWPVYILLGLVIISFVFFYGWNQNQMAEQRIEFARLESTSANPLRKWDYITAMEMQRAQSRAVGKKLQFIPDYYQQVLGEGQIRDLVSVADQAEAAANMKVIERAAEKMGIAVTRDDIKNFLSNQPGLTREVAQAAAARQGYPSVNAWAEDMRTRMEEDRAMTLVGKLAHASLFELWQEYLISKEEIGLEIAAYPVENFTGEVVVTEQDLIDHLNENKEDFRIPATRRYAHVTLTRQSLREAIQPTDEQLETYYQANQAQYQQPAAASAEELIVSLSQNPSTTETQEALDTLAAVRERAVASDAWSTLAQQLELDYPNTLFTYFKKPFLDQGSPVIGPEYKMALRTLEVDEVSSPMLDNTRAVMIRILEKREAGVPPLETVRTRVETDYVNQQVNEQFEAAFAKWLELRKEHLEIAAFAQAVNLRDELTTSVAVTETVIPGIGNLGEHANYIQMQLEPGELSDTIRTANALTVLQIASEAEGYDPPLAEVREKVEEAVRAEGSVERARLAAEQNLELVRGGADFRTALADAPVSPFNADPITRTEPVRSLGAPLLNFRQEAASLKAGTLGMSPYGYMEDQPIGYAIWKVTTVKQPTKAEFASERFQFMQEYLAIQQLAVIEEWLADKRREANFQLLAPALPDEPAKTAAK